MRSHNKVLFLSDNPSSVELYCRLKFKSIPFFQGNERIGLFKNKEPWFKMISSFSLLPLKKGESDVVGLILLWLYKVELHSFSNLKIDRI